MKDFLELTGRLKKAPADELRKEESGYLELVFSIQNLPKIYPVLEEFFGLPFKPAGVAPSKEAVLRAADYGGVEKHQTLYYSEEDGVSKCAMIWPWQDKTKATVKVAQGKISRQ